jgi:hypothetical protein
MKFDNTLQSSSRNAPPLPHIRNRRKGPHESSESSQVKFLAYV